MARCDWCSEMEQIRRGKGSGLKIWALGMNQQANQQQLDNWAKPFINELADRRRAAGDYTVRCKECRKQFGKDFFDEPYHQTSKETRREVEITRPEGPREPTWKESHRARIYYLIDQTPESQIPVLTDWERWFLDMDLFGRDSVGPEPEYQITEI